MSFVSSMLFYKYFSELIILHTYKLSSTRTDGMHKCKQGAPKVREKKRTPFDVRDGPLFFLGGGVL